MTNTNNDFKPISDFPTFFKSDVVWIGEITEGITSRVPRPGDTVFVEYAFDATRTTQTNISDDHIFHYPETLQKLSQATVHYDFAWDHEKLVYPQHRLIEFYNTRQIFSMQKGQKIVVVKMLQDKQVCITRTKDGNNTFLDNGMGKTCVLRIQEILSKDFKRTFFFPKLSQQLEESLKNLWDPPFLYYDKSDFGQPGIFVHVDTQKYSLIEVHTAFAQLLISRPPTLRAGDHFDDERGLFLNTVSKAYIASEPSLQRVLMAWARESDLEEDLLLVLEKEELGRSRGSNATNSA